MAAKHPSSRRYLTDATERANKLVLSAMDQQGEEE